MNEIIDEIAQRRKDDPLFTLRAMKAREEVMKVVKEQHIEHRADAIIDLAVCAGILIADRDPR